MKSREIRLVKRPDGLPSDDCFELASVELPEVPEGGILVRNLWMTVDPYMRGRMEDSDSYLPSFQIGAALEGQAVGEVVQSRNPNFSEGDTVSSMLGWREYFVADADMLVSDPSGSPFSVNRLAAMPGVPLQACLGVAGVTGFSAWVGIEAIAETNANDTVFVSGAAGAVGSMACQIAKLKGCTVIGSAGSDEKAEWLIDKAGVDHAINYKTTTNLSKALAELAPDGIDVYFENVGGDHLVAALQNMNRNGRIALCGMISQYNAAPDIDESNLFMTLVTKEIRAQGFLITSFYDRYAEYLTQFAEWLKNGQIVWEETVLDGIENAPAAFLGLFSGRNKGKMLVKLA